MRIGLKDYCQIAKEKILDRYSTIKGNTAKFISHPDRIVVIPVLAAMSLYCIVAPTIAQEIAASSLPQSFSDYINNMNWSYNPPDGSVCVLPKHVDNNITEALSKGGEIYLSQKIDGNTTIHTINGTGYDMLNAKFNAFASDGQISPTEDSFLRSSITSAIREKIVKFGTGIPGTDYAIEGTDILNDEGCMVCYGLGSCDSC